MLNTTLQGSRNSIFILHSFNINTVSNSKQYSSHKILSLSSLVMPEKKLTQCIRQGAILEVAEWNKPLFSHTLAQCCAASCLMHISLRTPHRCSFFLCLSMKSTAIIYFHLRDTFPRFHVQNLPASVPDVDEVKSFTLNAVPPRDGLKCHFGHE